MKILIFYLTNGYIQAVDIETVVPVGNSYIDRPCVQSIRLEKHGECRGSYRGNPWTYSKYLSSMGIAMNNWITIGSVILTSETIVFTSNSAIATLGAVVCLTLIGK